MTSQIIHASYLCFVCACVRAHVCVDVCERVSKVCVICNLQTVSCDYVIIL